MTISKMLLSLLATAATIAVAAPAGAQATHRLLRRAGGMVPADGRRLRESRPASRSTMTRKSSGEIYAQVKAEGGQSASGDIWWGGTGDPHMQAAEEGLTEEYKSPKLAELQRLGRAPVGAVEGPHRRHLFRRARLRLQHQAARRRRASPEPKCWADLLNPKLKDEVQVADPNSSGTAYTMLATLVQLMGEDKALRLPEGAAQEHQPVHQVGRGAGQGDEPRRDDRRHRLPARPRHHDRRRRADEGRRAVRGHRLRDRLDVDHQGREQPRERQEVVRLGADARGAGARRAGEVLPGAVQQERRRSRRRRRSSPRSS